MTGPSERRRGRPRVSRDQQRARLFDAAERVFERHAYEGASVLEIVREAGMSTRTFYEYYDSKDDLVEDLARDRAEIFLEQIEAEMGQSDDVVVAIDRILRVFLDQLPVVVVSLEHLGGAAGQRVRDVRRRYREAVAALLIDEFAQLGRRGLVREGPSPAALALVLAGIEGLVIGRHSDGCTRDDLRAMHPVLLSAIRELFPNLRP